MQILDARFTISDRLKERLQPVNDPDVLSEHVTAAATASSVDDLLEDNGF